MRTRSLPLARLQQLTPFERSLSSSEVSDRRAQYGGNDIVEVPGNPWLDLARDTAKDPMLWFFLGTGIVYALVGQRVEAITLGIAILPLLLMDAVLHRRTSASIQGLKNRLATEAVVIRNEVTARIPAVDIVPGDIVVVSSGDMLPADGVFVAGADLQVEESALTGEAYPVSKHLLQLTSLQGRDPLIEEQYWGSAGTRLLTGSGRLRVIFTGSETQYGEIIQSAIKATHENTPLQLAIRNLVKILLIAATLLCLALAAARVLQGYGWLDALVSAVTLATAAIPEEFPVAFTFFLGLGVYRLARQHALVRRAVTVENMGRVSYICSDKTGTLTEGKLHLTHVQTPTESAKALALTLAAVASREESGDPLDQAILEAAKIQEPGEILFTRLATFPFTENRKRETCVARSPEGAVIASCKGAAEVVFGMCELTETERALWESEANSYAQEGHKVIAVASKVCGAEDLSQEPVRGYEFVALLAFEDTVRDGVPQAVKACQDAGIHTIMVTGDHLITARAVANEIGLGHGSPCIISGDEIQELIRSNDTTAIQKIDVVARATPDQKLLLVRALKDTGEIVAVTGDGVNDVPALQTADIGVAMGERGTRSAREVASIVLLDDNFRTLVHAIQEGQQLFRNLQLSFQYLLIIHIPLVLTAAAIPLAGYPLVYLPIHIVWLEMIIHPTALLVFQEGSADKTLDRQRTRRTAQFFSRSDWSIIAGAGILLFAFTVGGYLRSLGSGHNVEHARATAMAVLTFGSAGCTAGLSRLRSRIASFIVAGTVASSVALIQIPFSAKLLHLQPLHWDDWVTVLIGTAIPTSLLIIRDVRQWTTGRQESRA
jgi:P-type Ca2+ transporter type 2C